MLAGVSGNDPNLISALQNAQFGVLAFTNEFEVLIWNAGAERIFGVSAAEAIGKKLPDVIATASRDVVRESVRKDGARIATKWHEESLGGGSTLAFVTDVTEENARKRTAENRERLLQAMLDNLSVVVWQIDLKGTFLVHDGKKGLEAIGLKAGQFLGQNMYDLYGQEGTNATISEALQGRLQFSSDEAHGRSWQSWTVPIFSADGVVEGVAGITLDITELRSGEKELRTKLALIEEQQRVIRELSTPLIETWDGVLTVPIVGTIDTERAGEVMENLLTEVTRRKARFAIVDLTGVEAVDTKVAAHIIGLVRAIQLLGAEGIVTGIRPNTAQTMVMLGADLSGINTHANLKEALRYCIQKVAAHGPY